MTKMVAHLAPISTELVFGSFQAFPHSLGAKPASTNPPPQTSAMTTNSPQPEGGCDGALSSLSATIEALNLVKQNSSVEPAKTVFGSAGVLLTTIRVCLLPTLRRWTSCSRSPRIRWSTGKTTSCSGFLALAYAKLSTGG
jgi:hypothetical protein